MQVRESDIDVLPAHVASVVNCVSFINQVGYYYLPIKYLPNVLIEPTVQ